MIISLFGKNPKKEDLKYIEALLQQLALRSDTVLMYEDFHSAIKDCVQMPRFASLEIFDSGSDISSLSDMLFSLGGDGTLLDTLCVVKNGIVPVLGINLGHLGFLTSVGKEDIACLLDEIEKGNYEIENHSVLKVEHESVGKDKYAMNEVCVRSLTPGELLDINAFVDDEFLATYTADGLIAATPTGSTAYSMSCGGPIISPYSRCLCITPVSPHNLTLRPIIIPESSVIRFVISEAGSDLSLHLDSQSFAVRKPLCISVSKADFEVPLIRMHKQNFFEAIRNKLMWGTNLRNRVNDAR